MFDGNDIQYQKWWLGFKAYAKIEGFGKALKEDLEADLPDTQVKAEALAGTETNTVLQKKAAGRDDKVVASFTFAFETDDLLNLAIEAQSEE